MLSSVSTSIATVILLIAVGGWILYAIFNARATRAEVGSEIELAANRKEYYDDEILEGRKIERTQLLGILFLAIITVALPLYWVLEPSRQAGAIVGFDKRFVNWGAGLFAPTAEGGFNCAGCHGGMKATGGVAPFAITDPKTGEVKSVNWKAPALNTVLYRFSEDEVRFILNYGRPFSPMSAWGTIGGGPMNDQQITTLISYLKSIQIPRDNCVNLKDDPKTCAGGTLPTDKNAELQAEAERLVAAGTYGSLGEAFFNLNLYGGGYSCARCHTKDIHTEIHKSPVVAHLDQTSLADRRCVSSQIKVTCWISLRVVPSWASATENRDKEAAECPRSVGCIPRPNSHPSLNTCGACDVVSAVGSQLATRNSRNPCSTHHGDVSDRWNVFVARHQCGCAARIHDHSGRVSRMDDVDGACLVDLRHWAQRSRANMKPAAPSQLCEMAHC